MTIKTVDPNTRDYAREYGAGWSTGERGTEGALERADRRGVSHAWYDGYHDAAAGREKWTFRKARRLALAAEALGFKAWADGGFAYVSAEEGDGAADYYGEFRGGVPWVNLKLESLGKANGGYWDWVNPGLIVFYE